MNQVPRNIILTMVKLLVLQLVTYWSLAGLILKATCEDTIIIGPIPPRPPQPIDCDEILDEILDITDEIIDEILDEIIEITDEIIDEITDEIIDEISDDIFEQILDDEDYPDSDDEYKTDDHYSFYDPG